MSDEDTSARSTPKNFAGSPWGSENNHWDEVPLRSLFQVFNGSTPKSGVDRYWGGEINWVTPADIQDTGDKWIESTDRKITDEGYESCGTSLVPKGSIILTIRAPIGKIALAGTEICTNQGCKSLVPNQGTNSKFYYYVLEAAQEYLKTLGEGATFNELGTKDLKSVRLPSPPSTKQQQIVSFLDYHTSTIDELVRKKNELLSLLEEKQDAYITKLITKGLDDQTIFKDSGIPTIGEIPSHWEVVPNRAVFQEVDERSEEGSEELLTVSHKTGVTPRAEKEVNMFEAESLEGYKRAHEGDFVINTMWAWMGAVGISPQLGVVSPSYHVYRPNDSMRDDFIDYLYRTPPYVTEMGRYSKGVWKSRSRLYPDEFLRMDTIRPPKQEQKEIVNKIQKRVGNIEELEHKLATSISLLQERREAIITAAVTGQIDVCDFAQVDEEKAIL